MNTEVRFIAAIGLMVLVLVGTNILFPPVEPELPAEVDSIGAPAATPSAFDDLNESVLPGDPAAAIAQAPAQDSAAAPAGPAAAIPRQPVTVEGPLFRHVFDNYGAALLSAELPTYASLRSANGDVQLVPEGTRALAKRLVVGNDTLDLSRVGFEVTPAEGLQLTEGGEPQTLSFRYQTPGGPLAIELDYTFAPDDYKVDVRTRITGLDRPYLLTSLGDGIEFNEADSTQEARAMAFVYNHLNEGVESTPFAKVDEAELVQGPMLWAGYRSRYFLTALLPGTSAEDEDAFLGGLLVHTLEGDTRARVEASQTFGPGGELNYRIYLGPQVHAQLQALGNDFEEVNPYGWRWLRPLLRPIVSGILWLLTFLHETLSIGYGWVLIIFGVMMRVILWPLNQKAMRAQIKNMAAQPFVKEIQTKYKDNPEKMQKEMMKLYKEHGFNPLGGCLPLLLPWPVLIALFFVFQNTIELRGVEFLWLPDLAAKDPIYLLPVILAVSMFALQYISFRSMPEGNPQMKTMMWVMPPVMGFIFLQFPSGLNLYYATSNIATLPQQIMIANERKKAGKTGKQPAPPKADVGGPAPSKKSGGKKGKRG